jgi:hypothetical protein
MKGSAFGAAVFAMLAGLPACGSSSADASPVAPDASAEAGDENPIGSIGEAEPPWESGSTGDVGPPDDGGSLDWVSGDGGRPEFACAEIAPVGIPTFRDVVSSPGGKLVARVRVKADPSAQVPLWLWLVTRTVPPPDTKLDVVGLDDGYTAVSIPIEQAGTYRIVVHSHYPGLDACAADITFEAK